MNQRQPHGTVSLFSPRRALEEARESAAVLEIKLRVLESEHVHVLQKLAAASVATSGAGRLPASDSTSVMQAQVCGQCSVVIFCSFYQLFSHHCGARGSVLKRSSLAASNK